MKLLEIKHQPSGFRSADDDGVNTCVTFTFSTDVVKEMLINFILSSQEELSDLAVPPDLPSHQLPAAARCQLATKLSILSIKSLSVNLVDLLFELSLINRKSSESHSCAFSTSMFIPTHVSFMF